MSEADTYLIERAQRIGEKGSKSRPILVSYHYFAEREAVRLKSYDKSGELKAAGVGIRIQLPKAIRDARKPLYDVMDNAKKAGKTVRFVGKNLFINGKLYKPEGMEHYRCPEEAELTFLSWNINGLLRKITDPDFLCYIENFDVICLSETWISNQNICNIDIRGFCSFHMSGNKSKGTSKGQFSGGITIYFKEKFKRTLVL
jgi:hypothetical protein